MKKIFHFTVAIALLTLLPLSVNAQCKGFAKKICKVELSPYIHDGNYHAAILTVGEEAVSLPDIEFRVIDSDRNVLYSNKDNEYAMTWDFRLEASQQLKIFVKVPNAEGFPEEIMPGCVAIMFGFLDKN